jgi:ribonuclease Y
MIVLLTAVLAGGAGVAAGRFLLRQLAHRKLVEAERQAAVILQNAQRQAEVEAKEKLVQARVELEKETRERRAELAALERRLQQREDHLDRKTGQLDRRDTELNRKEKDLVVRERSASEKEQRLENELKHQRQELERLAGLTAEEAKKHLVHSMEQEARFEAAKMMKRIEEEAREKADEQAKAIITRSIERVGRDYVAEVTVSTVHLPNDGMKGRIIGREGRNIRALESAAGIDLIIEDSPDTVVISSFDPFRREVARIALERLMQDGRIHPARIEEMVDKVKKEQEKLMREEAEKLLFDLKIHDLHPELVKLLGRLRYRTSYGQNNFEHVREAVFIASIMASELGLDVKLVKRGTLLHDIGKAVSHEAEGPHAAIGAELAKKYGESPKVVNAIAGHHGDVEPICIESVLVMAAESLSAARPGARRESVETYIKRLEKLEQLATSFKGVEKAYAIQAGREIRVIVRQEEISDAESSMLSRDLARKIEQELVYPGQIKVTIIRESRYVEHAR